MLFRLSPSNLPRPLCSVQGPFQPPAFSPTFRVPPGFGQCFFLRFPRMPSAPLKTFPGPTAASCGLSRYKCFFFRLPRLPSAPQNLPRPRCSVQGPFQPPAFSPTLRDCRLASANASAPLKTFPGPTAASCGLSNSSQGGVAALRLTRAAQVEVMCWKCVCLPPFTASETAVCPPQNLPRPRCSVQGPFQPPAFSFPHSGLWPKKRGRRHQGASPFYIYIYMQNSRSVSPFRGISSREPLGLLEKLVLCGNFHGSA